ncbi:hypothetical protein ACN9MD_13570 [Stenotrophomonas maltophilia]|jgi:hypothetical protein|uniref:hypothetical protein n=1 Tax=Stenotrophomonas TaxID=40323 RepID=UPI0010A9C54C|nr:hypothetical protein [Stenotrophomonas maltophilia]TIE18719.1 hypothetical protein DI034_06900 [Stenotrophomonas maltophilia]TIE64799.1 hypothetical protein DI041_01975 [Stenotrophomonas maltophilia]HEL7750887.1 hypothetical protein [Stenotrophomonas maltophilia]
MRRSSSLATLIVALFNAPQAMAAPSERDLKTVNFTGPLITPNPAGVRKGNWYIQPYLVRTDSKRIFDDAGKRQRLEVDSGDWSLLLPMSYGVSERLTGQISLAAVRAESGSDRSDGFRMTGSSAGLLYLLQQPSTDGTRPAISVSLTQRFATGNHDRITDNALNAQGDGVQRTTLGLGIQQIIWMKNERPLRWRAHFSVSPTPERIAISGASIYGTPPGFQGSMARGSVLRASIGAEYSFNPRWVAVMEIAGTREGRQNLRGYVPATGNGIQPIYEQRPASRSLSMAPALQYHFNASVGLIAGVEFTLDGRNSADFIRPQIALGMSF